MSQQETWEWVIEMVRYKPLKNDDNEYLFFQCHPCKSFIYICNDLLSFYSSPSVPMNDFYKFIFHSYQNCLRLLIGRDKYFFSIYSQYIHILFYLSDHLQISDNIFFSSTNFINSLKIKDKENKKTGKPSPCFCEPRCVQIPFKLPKKSRARKGHYQPH